MFNDYMVLTSDGPNYAERGGSGRVVKGSSGGRAMSHVVPRAAPHLSIWARPEVAGFAPDARYSHSATAIGSMIFIVGGLGRARIEYIQEILSPTQ